MHPYLTRLGVRPEVQRFFQPFFTSDRSGNLVFAYHDCIEHFGFAFHRVPVTANLWLAGSDNYSLIRQVVVAQSAMDAIAWLNYNYAAFSCLDNVLFLSISAGLKAEHISWVNRHVSGKSFIFIFSGDFLGRLTGLKFAAAIRRQPLAVALSEKEGLRVAFRFKEYIFKQDEFSLNAFERAAGYRFNIRTFKPKNHDCFLGRLMAEAFPVT